MSVQYGMTTIGELCRKGGGNVQTGPFGSQLKASAYIEQGVPVVMPADIIDFRVSVASIARVRKEDQKRLSRHQLIEGDIVYGRRGDIGRHALITKREEGWLCGTGCLRIRFGSAPINPRYVSYYLRQEHIIDLILGKAVGTTMANLNTGILESVPVVLPPRRIQDKVADILGALDDKIEVNQRISATLGAMGRALFKHWFVDFGPFQDGPFIATELGALPEGWSSKSLYDCAQYINGAAYRDFDFSPERLGLPIVKIVEIKNGITWQTKYTKKDMGTKYRIADGEILFSWSGSPDTSIGTFIWTGGDGWLNQHIFRVLPMREEDRVFGNTLAL